jgi:23S rRNA (cytosine1962-C5)-methyltransferase
MEEIRVSRQGEQSVISGHLWIFSNEVTKRPQDLPSGEPVRVAGERGNLLGIGYINTKSLIMVRLLARGDTAVDREFFVRRIGDALRAREGLYQGSFRAVNGESDFLPGLVIDVYGETVVVQMLTYGMERQKEEIVAAADQLLSPRTMVMRNDSPSRIEEGLALYKEVVKGQIEGEITIEEGPLKFLVDVLHGHKTGFYLDQRENRACLERYAGDRSFLDAFCYTGGFGLYALYYGARAVTFVDSSERALELARENVRINGLGSADFVKGDAFEFLKTSERTFDAIIIDPPSFIKSRKKIKEGERGYIDLHKRAFRRLAEAGLLFTFSCSHHMRRQRFKEIPRIAAYGYADLYLIREFSQCGDHPVLLTIPETEYLKGLLLRVKKREADSKIPFGNPPKSSYLI